MDIFRELEALMLAQEYSSSSVAETIAEIGSPSASVAILNQGEITAKCYSTLNYTTETIYQACSISKPIAGVGVMRLVSQGVLDLDTPITEYLPSQSLDLISTPQTRKLLKYVTLKQLLSHTSGMRQSGYPGYPSGRANPPDLHTILSAKPLCNTLQVRLAGFPGHTFSYSGGGMCIIQLIVETVTGRSLPELMQELVFGPLDMTRSTYRNPGGNENYATCFYNGSVPCEDPYNVLPELVTAGLWTTPSDLLKVVRAVQESLDPSTKNPFLPRELTRRMLTEISTGVALSWVAPTEPGNAFWHGGSNWPGFRCILVGFADVARKGIFDKNIEKCGICVMTNSGVGEMVYNKILYAITFLKKWPRLPDVPGWYGKIIPFCAPDGEISEKWKGWKGDWDGGKWRIDEHDGHVCAFFEKVEPVKLLPVAMPEDEGEVTLMAEGLGNVFHLKEEKGEKVIDFWHCEIYRGSVRLKRGGEEEEQAQEPVAE